MPAKSQARQPAAGAALSARHGDTNMKSLTPPAKSMASSTSDKAREEMASAEARRKPGHEHDA
ncbi:DUF3008 family protein [Burkholderia stabilis]|uniref:DUF3008 family protein n=1 Tax=Burkholderia stabilis TaxID=95485 RepID=UPI001589AA0D|nr:DUF3008 family protein [Burkholderia stabilis]